ncbi:uncharacterized protein [Lepeophtheirus salmonis]|uniref:uncharacterized protein isoform X2 n=1 Tax=Lepeophtheirus salmonis TaxID=72036 RepID=UPI003AF3E5FC
MANSYEKRLFNDTVRNMIRYLRQRRKMLPLLIFASLLVMVNSEYECGDVFLDMYNNNTQALKRLPPCSVDEDCPKYHICIFSEFGKSECKIAGLTDFDCGVKGYEGNFSQITLFVSNKTVKQII